MCPSGILGHMYISHTYITCRHMSDKDDLQIKSSKRKKKSPRKSTRYTRRHRGSLAWTHRNPLKTCQISVTNKTKKPHQNPRGKLSSFAMRNRPFVHPWIMLLALALPSHRQPKAGWLFSSYLLDHVYHVFFSFSIRPFGAHFHCCSKYEVDVVFIFCTRMAHWQRQPFLLTLSRCVSFHLSLLSLIWEE